jgi:glycosyltransferase involved in cell wall biosynthesis
MFFRGTSAITAVTDEIGKRLVEEENAPHERVRVVWNGVDGYKYRPRNGAFIDRKKAELGIPLEAFVLGTVGRCSEEKNQRMLLDILSLTPKEQSWFLVIVGDGPLREKLEISAAEKGIREKVKFTGIREDTEEIYPTFDVFLLSSNREGMPLVLIEAMACARPVVTTDVGGIKNIVFDDRNGYLVQPGNIAVMMDRLERLSRDADMRTRFGQFGRSFFEKYLSEEGMIEKYEQLFREILPL